MDNGDKRLEEAMEALKRAFPAGQFAIMCDSDVYGALEERLAYPKDGVGFLHLSVADVPIIYSDLMDQRKKLGAKPVG